MLTFCDRVGVLYSGRLCETGPSELMRHHARHPYSKGLMSSFPDLKGAHVEMHGIDGSPPSLMNPPPGCRFHPRCPEVFDACHQSEPQLVQIGEDHDAACHLVGDKKQWGPLMSQPLLNVQGLYKSYATGGVFSKQRLQALTDINFSLNRGEVIAIVGESGSGKSTIARQIVRLEEPDRGQILLDGHNVLSSKKVSLAYRQRVQMIFQDPFGSLNPVHTIAHHIARPLIRHGKVSNDKAAVRSGVLDLLKRVGLSRPKTLLMPFPIRYPGVKGNGSLSLAP